ncbi:hypothetical protein AB0L53_24980 [Nonomuraea sp. NPDC052129]|uniref:hypothetical protein n=1 Tax=Nonomuraea sp. NPDC052129 TaxID=3154651 RepID=UPI003412942E
MADELLVVRCQLGEREALAELVRAWHARRTVMDRLRHEYGTAETELTADPVAADPAAALVDRAELVAGLTRLSRSLSRTRRIGAVLIGVSAVLAVRAHLRRAALLWRWRELS